MKKFLRVVLILLLLVAATVVIAALIAPKETNITSTTVINAPKEAVWEQMVKFKNWPNWSPWHKMDPDQKLTYSGVDGEVGSSYSWVGEKTGEGSMTNKSVENGKMTYELKFVKPFESTAGGYLMVEDAGNGTTKATWTYTGNNDNFLWRGMGYLMGMKKMLQGQFDEGLANMKAYVESHKSEMPAAAPKLTVEEVQFAATNYAGYKSHVGMGDWEKVLGESLGKLQTAAGARISGAPVSIIYKWDDDKMEGDVLIGAPIADGKPVDGAAMEKVAATRAYKVAYVGDPAGTGAAHQAIGAKLAEKGEKDVLFMIEEYAVAGDKEKDKNKWVTNVYYLMK